MYTSTTIAGPVRSVTHSLIARAAVAMIILFGALPALAQQCPAGQRLMTFPPDGYFEFWRYATVSSNRAVEQWWYSESRLKRHERLPLGNGYFSEYFDFASQKLTLVQTSGGNIVECSRFDFPQPFVRPSVGANATWCFTYISDENVGGLLPVERWTRTDGVTVTQDVFAQRVGDELIPLWLYNRESSTIFTKYLNFHTVVDDGDFELPCTPIDVEGTVTEALQALEIKNDLPPGTLTDPGIGP